MGKTTHRQRYAVLLHLLHQARLAAQVRQVDVAKALKVPQSRISKTELGERRLDVIDLIDYLEAIEVRPVEFFQHLVQRLDAARPTAAGRSRRKAPKTS